MNDRPGRVRTGGAAPAPLPGRIAMRRAAALAAALLAAACGGRRVPPPAPVAVTPPVLRVDGVLPQGADAVGVTLSLQGSAENPNPFSLSVARFDYAVALEGQPVGRGQVSSGLVVPARAALPLAVPLRVGWAQIPGFLGLLATRRSLALHVTGAAVVPGPRGPMALPYAVAGEVALPVLPAVAFQGAALRESSVFQTVVELRLEVRNPNPFPLPTGHLAYDLFLSGVPVAQAASHSLEAVPAGGAAVVVVPVRFSTLGAAAGVLSGAMGGRAEVALRGRAGYGALEVAVDARGGLAR